MTTLNPDLFGININQEFQSGLNFPDIGGEVLLTTVTPEMKRYIQANVRELKRFGFKLFRCASPNFSWVPQLAYYRVILEIIAQEGDVHIEYGILLREIHNKDLEDYFKVVDAEAIWFQSLLDTYADRGVTGVWVLGNEYEQTVQIGARVQVTSITRVNNAVTVVWPYKHYAAVEDAYNFNNSFLTSNLYTRITAVPDEYTAIFSNANVAGPDQSQSGGYVTISADGMRRMVKRLAAHNVEDLGLTFDQSYSVLQGYEAANLYFFTRGWKEAGSGFPAIGKGYLRYVDLNIYGVSSQNAETNWVRFKLQVDAAIADIGVDSLRITEWNMNHNDDMDPTYNNNLIRRDEMLLRKKRYIESKGLRHYFFAWKMPAYVGEKFPIKSEVDAMIRPSFYRLMGVKSPIVEIRPL